MYDPLAPGAPDRLALLEYLRDHGATIDEMVEVHAVGRLPALAGRLVRREGRAQHTPRELAAAGVADVELAGRIWQAAGLPPLGPDELALSDADAAALTAFVIAAERFGEDAVLQYTRVVGAALASVADASTALFGLTVAEDLRRTHAVEVAQAEAFAEGAHMLVDVVPAVMGTLFLHHVDRAVERYVAGGGDVVGARVAYLAVGFVDIVESTASMREQVVDDIAAAVTDFEQRATEVVAAHRGRVVKTIGDEVMFVATTALDAAQIASELVEFSAHHPDLRGARGGLAWGRLVRGYADFYGPVVNLAARAVKQADPGEVLADREMVAQLADASDAVAIRVGARREVELRGFGEPIGLWPVARTGRPDEDQDGDGDEEAR